MISSFRRPLPFHQLLSHGIAAQTCGKTIAAVLLVRRRLDTAQNPNGQRRAVGVEADTVLRRPAAAECGRLEREIRLAGCRIGRRKIGQGIAFCDQAQPFAVKL